MGQTERYVLTYKENQSVMIHHGNDFIFGKVVKKHATPRSYVVETEKAQIVAQKSPSIEENLG